MNPALKEKIDALTAIARACDGETEKLFALADYYGIDTTQELTEVIFGVAMSALEGEVRPLR